jgi:uncharacterized YccA/Bax inhibitor family protein
MPESSNPVFSRKGMFESVRTPSAAELEAMVRTERPMTVAAVVDHTAVMLAVLIATAAGAWALDVGTGLAVGAAVAGLVLALVIIFKRITNPAPILAYSAIEGVFLGAISRVMDEAYPGIAVQAVIGTVLCFGAVLWGYRTGRLQATPRFRKVIIGALVAILGLIVANLLVSLFGGSLGIRDGGPLAIAFSLVVITVASLSFVLDFDEIERAAAEGAPERFAWLAAFGLVVGLVWLYIEILRFLSYLRD